MRVYKPKRKNKDGNAIGYERWYIDFTDHLDRRQRWQGFTDKKLTETVGRNLEELVRYKIAQQQPAPALIRWLEDIPDSLRKKLVKSSILDIRQASGNQTLSSHIKDFKAYLLAKGNDSEYVETVLSRLNRIIQDCRFITWTDISASRVLQCLSELQGQHKKGKRVVEGIGNQTYNFYLQAIKQFCRWMCKDRRASESPVAHLDKISSHKVKNNRKRNRRVLDVEDFKHLLAITIDQPTRYGLTGSQRSMVYRFAAETGLRRDEIRSLTPNIL
jgi:hypothetical protein